ncbi:hypothetical protein [Sphingomonas montanisoli]|uniref:Uncharacterized protein n=1 Tax=Sphingomonas montanisoli TaxID=2606412 RepID=A0A5D9BWL0_9SPHN|nr:hypothetical protein [Sphingomonas montanisoli]TZG23968.1 hypothetical protein FYJ91_20420 [Sphingomonas montanisoli]
MSWAAAWSFATRIGPWIIIAGLAAALLLTRAKLTEVRLEAKVEAADAKLGAAQSALANERRTGAAIATYAERTAALQPLIVRSTDTVTRYAETPAGRAPCAAPDRVLGIDQLDAALWSTASPASGRGGALPAHASAAPGGR